MKNFEDWWDTYQFSDQHKIVAQSAWNAGYEAGRSEHLAAPSQEPVAWMTHESAHRLKKGGNCKGAVPVHQVRSHTAKIPLYTHPIDAAAQIVALNQRALNAEAEVVQMKIDMGEGGRRLVMENLEQRRVMQMALEALETISDEWGFTSKRHLPLRFEAITALRGALE